jgi:hypothetical protein
MDPRPHHYRQAEITPPFVTVLQRVGFPHPYKTKVIIIHLGIIRRIRPWWLRCDIRLNGLEYKGCVCIDRKENGKRISGFRHSGDETFDLLRCYAV